MSYITTSVEKNRLRKIFSRIAQDYDVYASLQKRIAQRLLVYVHEEAGKPESILDIGMGTGWLTKELPLLYPNCNVFGIDFAEGMIAFASKDKGKCFLAVADAESLPFKDESFELVISNLSYQWVNNLPFAFGEILRTLRKNGRFYITCFGNNSLQELRFSFSKVLKQRALCLRTQDNNLPDEKLIYKSLLGANLKNIKITSYIEKETYDDLFALIRWLKNIGANQITRPFFMGQRIWEQANRFYLSNYRHNAGVFATFEVIWAEGLKQ